jgi:hypothetical protein
MNYREIYSTEIHGTHGSRGLKILVAHPGDQNLDTEAIRHATYDAAKLVLSAVMEAVVAANTETQEAAKQVRAAFLGLFPEPIFVEEIPNGYCSDWCCKHLPWFVVTTKIGRIKIGCRKRVINIDWSETKVPEAEALFPQEDVTKSGRSIHAWGFDKAREYVLRILNHERDEPNEVSRCASEEPGPDSVGLQASR